MEEKEFNDAVGKIMGVKSGVEWVSVRKEIASEKLMVRLQIQANEQQIKKLIPLILNHN